MDYETLVHLRKNDASWRLLTSTHAPLILSFLHQVFIKPNERSMPFDEATSKLDDYLYHLNDIHGSGTYPKQAREYLDDWANGIAPFLRKYYIQDSDVPQLDLTPGAEKAIAWMEGLQPREFVGTESRLLTLYRLLKEISQESERDIAVKIADLERQKAELEGKIASLQSGVVEPGDPVRIKERWFEAEDTARQLLSDFRQVEYNFRGLDREVRELIATSDKAKGELLDEIFAQQDYIHDSEQGRSFNAFWEFLMSPQRQQELEGMTEIALQQDVLQSVADRQFLPRIAWFLLEAGEKVFRTNAQLVEQLRKYLADQAWQEDRRILKIIRGIEKSAIQVRDHAPAERNFTQLDQPRLGLDLVMERTLFEPRNKIALTDVIVDASEETVDVQALYEQHWVDQARLKGQIRRLLQDNTQVSLPEVLKAYPLEQGLAELISYLNLASHDDKAIIDETVVDLIDMVGEPDEAGVNTGKTRQASLPRILFTRG